METEKKNIDLKAIKEEAKRKKEAKKEAKKEEGKKKQSEETGEIPSKDTSNVADSKSKAKKKVEVNIPDKETNDDKQLESSNQLKQTEIVKQKPKKMVFSMTTYDDLMLLEREKKQVESKKEKKIDSSLLFNNVKKDNHEINSRQIIEMLAKENITCENEDLFITLLKISRAGINKQGMVCRELINAVKILIQSHNEPKIFLDTVSKLIEIVKKLSHVIGGLNNTCKFIKNILQKIQNNKNIDKEAIINKFDEFINTKINTKDFISYKHGINLIKENDCILIYGKSQIFRKLLTKAVQKKINFKVIYVDNIQNNYIKTEIEFLSKLGVNVVYSYLNGISGIIDKVTKVFVKAKSMLSNGNLLGDVGTSLISCIAYNFKKPVISFCETYKFWDKILMNAFQSNNTQIETITEHSVSYNRLKIMYDITPANFINMVVCEHGFLPPTSVPVVIREFEKEEVEFE